MGGGTSEGGAGGPRGGEGPAPARRAVAAVAAAIIPTAIPTGIGMGIASSGGAVRRSGYHAPRRGGGDADLVDVAVHGQGLEAVGVHVP